jgi:hypothetical protein
MYRRTCVVIALMLAVACGGNVKSREITDENKAKIFDEIKQSKDLTVEEVGLLQAYVLRKGLGDALSGKTPELPVGMTIGQMIDDQRTWAADQRKRDEEEKLRVARARAEEDAQRKKLLDAVAVTVFDKGFQDADYQEYVTIRVMYENKSGKDIRGFKGALQFNDLFGAEILPFTISEDESLKAGETKRQGWTLKYNQFIDRHVKLRNTALDNMKVEWKPQIILFSDGTSLEVKSAS